MKNQKLESQASQISFDLVRLSHQTKTPHLGSNLSPVSILTALYFDVMNVEPSEPKMPERDRIFMSKGHASPSLYIALAHRGFYPVDDVFTLAQNGSRFEEHAGIDAPAGVESVSGSLGHALSLASGMALSAKLQHQEHHHFVIMGDGELNEGSVWEAAMFAPANKLNNITAIVDHNKWQATGRSQEVFGLKQIHKQFEAFGWDAYEVDGHDLPALCKLLRMSKTNQAPTAIIAHTVKGKGVSFMEDDNNWHYRIPTEEEVELARDELLGKRSV